MKSTIPIDFNKVLIAQARIGKSWKELGIDQRLIARAKDGFLSPFGLHKLANALGVDPAEIVKEV